MFEFCTCLSVPKFNKADTDGTAFGFKSFFFNQKCFALVRGYLAEKIFHRGYLTEKRLKITALDDPLYPLSHIVIKQVSQSLVDVSPG